MTTVEEATRQFEDALLHVDRSLAAALIESRCGPDGQFSAVEDIIVTALEDIGAGWEAGRVSLAQVYMSGVIVEELVRQYFPAAKDKIAGQPTIGIGVLEDQHTLGKRIVMSMLRAAGYAPIDLGDGLGPEEIVDRATEHQIDILLISVLMLSSALKTREVKERLEAAHRPIKLIVGGAPFRLDPGLWRKVGADATGDKASDILLLIEKVNNNGSEADDLS